MNKFFDAETGRLKYYYASKSIMIDGMILGISLDNPRNVFNFLAYQYKKQEELKEEL